MVNHLTKLPKITEEVFNAFEHDALPDGWSVTCYEEFADRQFYRIIDEDGTEVARWGVDSLMGCNLIAVSHSVVIEEPYRNKGLGLALRKARLLCLAKAGFQSELCTVRLDNEAQVKIMTKTSGRWVGQMISDKGGFVNTYLTTLLAAQ